METVESGHMAGSNQCAVCGTALPGGALEGLCPACLLRQTDETATDPKHSSFDPPSIAELAPAFPQLEILEFIGKGGMGAVYKARQKQLDRTVALKILPSGSSGDPSFAERFAREAKALAHLNHPGIVTLFEFGQTANPSSRGSQPLYFFLMEHVDGVNLRQLLTHGRLSPREALAIVPQICDALQFAHDQGIVHRDIKPENILLDRRGRVKVADFGLAKILGAGAEASAVGAQSRLPGAHAASAQDLTEAGKVMGTPRYMSPEQIHAPGQVDHRADIYALGVVFYQMLTGELPDEKLQPPSRKVHIDVRLDEVVLRALEKNPQMRYQQVSDVKTMVETITQTVPVAGQPQFNRMFMGFNYRSKTTLFGWPLVNIVAGMDPLTGKPKVAKGIIAIGGIAKGFIAIGGLSMGVFSFGGCALGVVAYGGLSVGMLALGGLALAVVMALGGGAAAPISVGGAAVGYYACGGAAIGVHAMSAVGQDPVAKEFFSPWVDVVFAYFNWINIVFVLFVVGVGILAPMWARKRAEAVGDCTGGDTKGGQESEPMHSTRYLRFFVFAVIAGLLLFAAWGNPVGITIGAGVLLLIGLAMKAKPPLRFVILVNLVGFAIALSVILLLQRFHV